MKKIICDHCGRPYEPNKPWGALDKNLDVLDADGIGDEIKIDLCQECYLAMEKEIKKIHTRYATMLKRRKKA